MPYSSTGVLMMEDKIRIHCINRRDAMNLGDRLISYSLEAYFRTLSYDVRTHEYLGTALGQRCNGFINRLSQRLDRSVAGVYLKILATLFQKRPDVYLIGGGQLLRDNSTFPHAMLGWAIVSMIHNVPLILYSVGLDIRATGSRIHNFALRFLCRTAAVISVRDDYSRDYLVNIGFSRVKVVPDVVFLNPSNFLPKKESPGRGVVVFVSAFMLDENGQRGGFTSRDDYFEQLWVCAARELIPNEEVIVGCSSRGDAEDAASFAQWLVSKNLASGITYLPPTGVDEFIGMIRGARLVVSTRMHPIIVAKLLGVDYSVVPFNKKTEDMANTLDATNVQQLVNDSRRFIDSDIKAVRKRSM